jgi:inositol phosphorylceramide mannosyltransferase catalytic subunit
MIPKIIHRIWLDGKNECPTDWLETFRDHYSDWDYRLWTEDNIPELFNQDIFEDEMLMYARADILRYEMVYKYGGVYFDADMVSLKKIPDEFLKNEFFSAYENEELRPDLVVNAVFGAEKGHPILNRMIKELRFQDKTLPTWKYIGPEYFTKHINAYEGQKKIYPSYYFHPVHFLDKKKDKKRIDKAYTYHFWGTSTGKFKK